MNIVIVGQGAIGSLWYVSLVQHLEKKHPISCISSCLQFKQNDKQHKPKKHNLVFSNIDGSSLQLPVEISSIENLRQANLILICVKSYQVVAAVKELASIIPDNCTIVLCHNGMGTLIEISPLLNKQQTVLTLLVTHGCFRVNQNHIIHTGIGDSQLGLVYGQLSPTIQNEITSLLNSALAPVTWQQNIKENQWQKLAVNCVINPLTAINNVYNGALAQQKYQALIKEIITEVIMCAAIIGVILEYNQLHTLIMTVINKTAKNKSSMLQDILAKRPTEINYINGFIHKTAIEHQLETPANSRLWQQILQINQTT